MVGDIALPPTSGQLLLGADFAPGDYVLEITVTGKLANAKTREASQWMDFELK